MFFKIPNAPGRCWTPLFSSDLPVLLCWVALQTLDKMAGLDDRSKTHMADINALFPPDVVNYYRKWFVCYNVAAFISGPISGRFIKLMGLWISMLTKQKLSFSTLNCSASSCIITAAAVSLLPVSRHHFLCRWFQANQAIMAFPIIDMYLQTSTSRMLCVGCQQAFIFSASQ